jgi:hypothetical protein
MSHSCRSMCMNGTFTSNDLVRMVPELWEWLPRPYGPSDGQQAKRHCAGAAWLGHAGLSWYAWRQSDGSAPSCPRAGACPQGGLANAACGHWRRSRALPPFAAFRNNPERAAQSRNRAIIASAARAVRAALRPGHPRSQQASHHVPAIPAGSRHRTTSRPSPQAADIAPFARRSAARHVDEALLDKKVINP